MSSSEGEYSSEEEYTSEEESGSEEESEEESSEEEEEDKTKENEAKEKAAEAERKRLAEIEERKAEVRKRLEVQNAAAKKKKGFMTPERKRKLRMLLRKKAAEELKKEANRKASERRRIIDERCGKPACLNGVNETEVIKILEGYQARLLECEGYKWDLEYMLRIKDYEINDLNSKVNDLRGKFVKPSLKKVSTYENKFAKLQKTAKEFGFKVQLNKVS